MKKKVYKYCKATLVLICFLKLNLFSTKAQNGPVCDTYTNAAGFLPSGLGSNKVYGVYASGSTVYAATDGGLSISTDGGTSFTNKTTANGLGSNTIKGVYASGSTVYAATSGGLSISTDGGSTFTNKTTTNGLGNNIVNGVYASGSTVYAATGGGLSISTDGGSMFTNTQLPNTIFPSPVYGVYASGSTIYAATNGGGLSISTNGGTSYTTKTTANGLGNNTVYGVYASGSTVYAATDGGLSISTNGGGTFTNKTTTNGLGSNTVKGVYVMGSSVYAATSGGLSISTDGGSTFTKKTTTNGLGSNTVNGVYASGSMVYAATNGGLSISTDGGSTFTNISTTRQSGNGLGSNTVYGVYASGSTVYAATDGGLSISTDGGGTFTNKTTTNGLGSNTVFDVYASGSTVYAAGGGLSISTDGGTTFTNKTTANGLGSNSVKGVYASGSSVYVATGGGLSISTDGGGTFTNKTTTSGLGNDFVHGVYASGGTIYAATGGGLSISTDGGATFTNKTTTSGLGNDFVYGVYASGGTIYAATLGGLSISTDGGATFTNKTTTNGLGSLSVYGVYASGSTVYAATSGGLSISTDGGSSFTNKTSANGLGSNTVNGVYASDLTVYAATNGGLSFCSAPCTNPTSGGTIASAQIGGSPFDPAAFTSSTAPSGYTGTLEYKWQSSITSSSTGFSDIASSNSATYDPASILQTTWYKRLARVSCKSDWTGAAESNVLEVTVVSSVTWNGSGSTDWNTAANWTPNVVPNSGTDIVIPTGLTNYPAVPATVSLDDFNVQGISLALGSSVLTLTGNLTNNGTISGAGSVKMAGSSAQTISGTGSISNLEINNAAGVTISSGAGHMLTITGKLTPTSGTLTTNGNLTLRSSATGTARVGAGSAAGGYVSGNVVTQRYLSKLTGTGRNGRAWRLVTIPVTGTGTLRDVFMAGQSGTDLTVPANRSAQPNDLGTVVIGHNQPNASAATGAGYDWIGTAGQVSSLRYYQQNATSGSFASSQVPLLTTTYTSAAQGYMLFARGDRQQTYNGTGNSSATVLQATGALKQGTINVAIPALASAGFVLVGNPYMAVLDLEKVILDNATVIDNTVYIWDANIDGNAFKQGGYRAVTRTGVSNWTASGAGANPQYIESGSAFFVKPTATGGTLSIKEAHKVDGTPGIAPHGGMTDGPSRFFINLEVTDTANRRLVDGAVAFFNANYKDDLGDPVDIAPMTNLTAGSITLRQSGVRLSMEGRPWPADSAARIIPVDMRNLGDDAYVLRILPTNMNKEGFTAWLKDRHLNQETSLKTADETLYPFRRTGDLGIDSSRFEIVYRLSKPTNAGTLTPDDAAGEIGPRLYPNPAKSADVKLSLGSLAPGRYEVQVLDISGRSVMTRSIEHLSSTGAYQILKGQKLSTGQYLIRLSFDGKVLETIQFINE